MSKHKVSTYIPIRVRIRLFLKKVLPHFVFSVVHTVWIHTFARLFNVQGILEKHTALFLSRYPKIVHAGPFAGMKYTDKAIGSNYLHKLIGSYESVLHQYIHSLRQKNFDTIIDIGAAEGYYLVGFGKMFPHSRLVGFEIEEEGRLLIQEMYEKNNLHNKIILEGEATVNNVAPYITDSTLLVCDCEGAEVDILNPLVEKVFTKVDTAIIELHDFIRPGIKEALTERFANTHHITVVPFRTADVSEFPFLNSITNKTEQYEILRERGWQEQEWIILERKEENVSK